MFYVFTKKNIPADSEETLEEAGKEISTNKENICFEYISQPLCIVCIIWMINICVLTDCEAGRS